MVVPYLKKNGKYSLYNTAYDFKEDDKEFRFPFDKTNKDKLDNKEFNFIHPFADGFAIAENDDNQCFINVKGEIIKTEHKYFSLRNFENGIAVGCRDLRLGYSKYRFINKNGREIIDRDFNEYHRLKKGFIQVTEYIGYSFPYDDDFFPTTIANGLMDYSGFLIIEPIIDASFFLLKNFIKVYCLSVRGNSTFYFDYNGNQIFDEKFNKFEYIDTLEEGRGIAQLKTKEYVIIDDELNVIKNLGVLSHLDLGMSYSIFEDSSYSNFIAGLCAIKRDGKWGFIDINGNYVFKPKYDYAGAFTDYKSWSVFSKGCAIVGMNLGSRIRYGAINSKFEEITEFIYEEMNFFEENISTVRIKDKWGAINSEGKIVVPIEFTYISTYCCDGFIEVGLGDYDSNMFVGKRGLFNKNGLKITKILFDYIGIFELGFAIVVKGGKYGLINHEGLEVVQCRYNDLSGNPSSGYIAKLDGVKFYMDSSGREFREE